MADINVVVLVGRLTRDPELRYTPGGTAVAALGLAVTNRRKVGEEWKDEPCYVNVNVFGRQAESCSEYLAKGRQVGIEGRLVFSKWEKDGQTRTKLEVTANTVQFIGPGKAAGGEGAPRDAASPSGEFGDEVPF
jgi:single-strand DNA-binding protein